MPVTNYRYVPRAYTRHPSLIGCFVDTFSNRDSFTRLWLLSGSLMLAFSATTCAQPLTDNATPDGFYGFSDDIPEVLTTTRLRQPKTRVPGSTTVITGDMIRDLGITSLAEIFRLVPGMVVTEVGSGTPVTTYHGTVHYEQRRLQVLVDGRTAHRTNLSDVDWLAMPVPLELIERIEVARGPNSAAYGINAFLATINIITRDPADTAGVELRAVRGSRDHARVFSSVGGAGEDFDWRLAYEKRKFEGFDYQIERNPDTGENEKAPFHDGHDLNVFTYDSRLKFSPDLNLELRAGVVDGIDEEDQFKESVASENPDIDVRDYYLHTKFNVTTSENHFFHVMAGYQNFDRRRRWAIELPYAAINCLQNGLSPFDERNYSDPCFAVGGDPVTARINSDSEDSRLELEFQDTVIFNDDLKLVSGIGYRHDVYRSETFFNGRGTNDQSRIFANVEYTPIQWLTLNAGGNWEYTTTTHEGYFSPRVAANFLLHPNHVIRFVYSKAVRTPDGFEQDPDYGFTLRDVGPPQYANLEGFRVESDASQSRPYLQTLGRELEEETIESREISYFGQFPLDQAIFSLEVRAFDDKLRDMISGLITFDDWTIDNNVSMDQKGFEVEATVEYPGTTFRIAYGYLDQDDWYDGPEILDAEGNINDDKKAKNVRLLGRLSVRHSGSVAVIQDLPWGLKASAATYWADEFEYSEYQRLDFRLAKWIHQSSYTAELAFTMQHYVHDIPVLSEDNNINQANQFFFEAGVRF